MLKMLLTLSIKELKGQERGLKSTSRIVRGKKERVTLSGPLGHKKESPTMNLVGAVSDNNDDDDEGKSSEQRERGIVMKLNDSLEDDNHGCYNLPS